MTLGLRPLLVGGILLLAVDALAASEETSRPAIDAVALAIKPALDGRVVGDAAWHNVKPATGFKQTRPFEGRAATQRTEVYIGFTKDALYVGVVCFDDEPSKIIVSDSRRDSSLNDTDSFQVIFDSHQDRQNGFVFGTNPAGIEYDGQVSREGDAFNLDWNTTWEVRSQVSDIGWSAEMEIPFTALRYGASETQTWGVNFQRNIRRNNEIAFWSPLSRNHGLFRLSSAGAVRGIAVPRQRNLQLTPYVLGSTRRGGGLDGTDSEEEIGFDLKYSITPSLTLDATYNTDFAQVEVDELQVNLDRFSLFLPEKRPFFLENSGQFTVGRPREIELFFSRRIGIGEDGDQLPIDGGLRLSGKIGPRTNVGVLRMRSEAIDGVAPQNDFSVIRVNQELADRSYVGVMAVERDGDGSFEVDSSDDYNRTYAVDGQWGVGQNLTLVGFAAKTDTPGLTGKDHAYSLRANYNSSDWRGTLGYSEVAPDFNPEVGFLSRRDYRRIDAFALRRYRPENLWGLHELRPHIAYRGFHNFDGVYETGFVHVDNHWEWRNGYEVHTGMNFLHEDVQVPFEIVSGVTVPAGTYNHREADLVFTSDQSAPFSVDLRTRIGGLFGGDRISINPTLRYRVGERLSAELSWNYNDIDLPVPDGDFTVSLGRLRVSYSFTPKILLQALVQYNERDDLIATNLRFAWLQSATSGLYLVYNEIDDDSIGAPREPRREFVLKYSRIINLLR